MDKKQKKRLEVVRQKIEKTQKLLSAAKAQTDDPQEVRDLEHQLSQLQAEQTELKKQS
jgi:predicted  nucleic acid-binding Zn-ribbon protein